jgi:ubiquinone/menaquinone biosynthesis C-methylase UbiE
MKILDLGCGNSKKQGSIGVDSNPRTSPDVLHDLNKFPYPFENNFFDQIFLDNSLEHLEDVVSVMEEIYRITKPGGNIKIIVPYFRSLWAFGDITHKTFFAVRSMELFDIHSEIAKKYDYTKSRFFIEKIVFNENLKNHFFKKIILKIANKYPLRYEIHFSHLYPLDDITYYLKKPIIHE